jgi:hypothetical protein
MDQVRWCGRQGWQRRANPPTLATLSTRGGPTQRRASPPTLLVDQLVSSQAIRSSLTSSSHEQSSHQARYTRVPGAPGATGNHNKHKQGATSKEPPAITRGAAPNNACRRCSLRTWRLWSAKLAAGGAERPGDHSMADAMRDSPFRGTSGAPSCMLCNKAAWPAGVAVSRPWLLFHRIDWPSSREGGPTCRVGGPICAIPHGLCFACCVPRGYHV